jgi:hypothetical protein
VGVVPLTLAPWTDIERDTLAEMWLAGEPASAIGIVLGRTRCSVLGVVHRTKNLPPRVTTIARSHAQRRIPAYKPRPLPESVTPAVELKPFDPPIYTKDLRDAHCRWPYDIADSRNFIYCGAARDGASWYCADHNVIAFQPKIKKDVKNAS